MKKGQLDTLFMIIFMFVAFIVLLTVFSNKDQKFDCNNAYKDTPIYSLHTGNSVSGGFIVGFGSINSYMRYYVYQKEGQGMILRSMYAENIIIVETNTTQPVYRQIILGSEQCFNGSSKDMLIVPIGTIKQEFKGVE